jgi:hypothetical protein
MNVTSALVTACKFTALMVWKRHNRSIRTSLSSIGYGAPLRQQLPGTWLASPQGAD